MLSRSQLGLFSVEERLSATDARDLEAIVAELHEAGTRLVPVPLAAHIAADAKSSKCVVARAPDAGAGAHRGAAGCAEREVQSRSRQAGMRWRT